MSWAGATISRDLSRGLSVEDHSLGGSLLCSIAVYSSEVCRHWYYFESEGYNGHQLRRFCGGFFFLVAKFLSYSSNAIPVWSLGSPRQTLARVVLDLRKK